MMPHGERLEHAVTAMIDELRAEQSREGELSRALVVARHRRAELQRSVTILIKTFPAADRRRLSRQLERVETLCRAPRRRPGATERSEAVLAFLVTVGFTRLMVVGQMAAMAAMPILAYFAFPEAAIPSYFATALVLIRHAPRIRNVLNGTEPKMYYKIR